ncbi:helix-turn-helix transcriptional regulator [Phenylobacterium sp.]|uniref:helix-turn-helix transcriptional regulator n=1 Tax=Phenylobacterium sp. TaxID=1871053 RepID=UPI0035B4EF20
MRSTSEQILLLLKSKGPASTRSLAEQLGVSRQGALQQLEKLETEGLVQYDLERQGVGRPSRSWSISAKGQDRFPNTHAQLTVELLDAVRAEFGEAGLERLVQRREAATQAGYRQAIAETADIAARLDRLTRLRAAEGYMAEWRPIEDGYLLIENHCPICAAAAACQGFCRSELAMFRALLAPASVERTEHVLAGARRCAYLVRPWTSSSSST